MPYFFQADMLCYVMKHHHHFIKFIMRILKYLSDAVNICPLMKIVKLPTQTLEITFTCIHPLSVNILQKDTARRGC